MSVVKKPCIGCIYFHECGSTTRFAPCSGRKTKREAQRELQELSNKVEKLTNILEGGSNMKVLIGIIKAKQDGKPLATVGLVKRPNALDGVPASWVLDKDILEEVERTVCKNHNLTRDDLAMEVREVEV